jgi:Zn-dependent protease/predicted transcriptional regulator
MRGSFTFARVFGIDLKIHFTFLIILALIVLPAGSAAGMAFSALFVLLLFACVTLHELGHSVVAMRYGITVREIVLLPIGGVAVMGRIPENPRQELAIAVAGPLVNVGILAVLIPLWLAMGGEAQHLPNTVTALFGRGDGFMTEHPSAAFALVSRLIATNAMLILFNMIPAFPLDGGRVFRSLLAMRMPHAKATRIAAGVGQIAAVALAVVGLFGGNIMLAVIAFFIFMGAGAESSASRAGTVLATRRVGDAYNRTAIVLSLDTRVSQVIEHILTSYQPDFAVVNRGRLAGVVTRDDVLKWLAEAPSLYDVYVTEVMREADAVLRVDAKLTLDEVTKALDERETRIAAVYDDAHDHFLGLVSSEDIAEAQAVLTFLNRRLASGGTPTRAPWPVPMREVPRA